MLLWTRGLCSLPDDHKSSVKVVQVDVVCWGLPLAITMTIAFFFLLLSVHISTAISNKKPQEQGVDSAQQANNKK